MLLYKYMIHNCAAVDGNEGKKRFRRMLETSGSLVVPQSVHLQHKLLEERDRHIYTVTKANRHSLDTNKHWLMQNSAWFIRKD